MDAVDSDVPIDPAALAAAGISGVLRYLHTLTRAEVDAYHAHGISVGLVWELDPQAALGGSGQGSIDAQAALRAVAALGAPKGVAIWFAVDVDPGDPPAPAILDYFRATAVVRGSGFRNGSYAGAPAQIACLAAQVVDLCWGTAATSWDHGLTVPERVLQQGLSTTVAGVAVDPDAVLAPDWGQWAPVATSPAAPTPTPAPTPEQEDPMTVKHCLVQDGDGWWLVRFAVGASQMAIATPADGSALKAALGATDRGLSHAQLALIPTVAQG